MNIREEIDRLVAVFPSGPPLFDHAEHVTAAAVPEPYRGLLEHDHHMTMAMEQFHGHAVRVHVVDRHVNDEGYYRTSVLTVPDSLPRRTAADRSPTYAGERAVQFAAIRFNFEFVTTEVRDAIILEAVPLGQVLIDYNVLRHIDVGALLRLRISSHLARIFGGEPGTETYGRLATIFCNGRPAVGLLEVSAPLLV